jgi:hypothetical protein
MARDETGREEWVPAFEGQRPPFQPGNDVGRQFEPGNELSTHHGAYSVRRVDPLARELIETVLGDEATAYLRAPRWAAELAAWARAEAAVLLLEKYLAKKAEEAGGDMADLADERVRSAMTYLHRCEARAAERRKQLGLTPLSAARLNRDRAIGASVGIDVAKAMERLEREEREREESGDGG